MYVVFVISLTYRRKRGGKYPKKKIAHRAYSQKTNGNLLQKRLPNYGKQLPPPYGTKANSKTLWRKCGASCIKSTGRECSSRSRSARKLFLSKGRRSNRWMTPNLRSRSSSSASHPNTWQTMYSSRFLAPMTCRIWRRRNWRSHQWCSIEGKFHTLHCVIVMIAIDYNFLWIFVYCGSYLAQAYQGSTPDEGNDVRTNEATLWSSPGILPTEGVCLVCFRTGGQDKGKSIYGHTSQSLSGHCQERQCRLEGLQSR